jgi:phosphoribosylformylglycinamidine synthase
MFAQANSEHCRHKIFNASWIIDGEQQDQSAVRHDPAHHAANPQGTVLAYADNAAILEGVTGKRFFPGLTAYIGRKEELTHYVAKCETHNIRPPSRVSRRGNGGGRRNTR